jgi:Xaa-Pro aminopeptidase
MTAGAFLVLCGNDTKKNAKKPLKKGNVFTVEPTIHGEVNLGLEDDIVVREKAELLSHPQDEIIIMEP